MKIYKDIFTGDEIFSDTYKFKLVNEVVYEIYGKLVTRKCGDVGTDDVAEEEEGIDETEESGIDIVLNHRLQETSEFDCVGYMNYLKEYAERVVGMLQKKSPDQVDVVNANLNTFVMGFSCRFERLKFFRGESMNPDGMVIVLEFKVMDGKYIPVLYAFKHGLEEEIIEN